MSLAGEVIEAKRRVLWTPTWSNVTQGSGAINEGWYLQREDGLVDYAFRLQFGTTPSFSTTIQITLPEEAWTGSGTELQATVGYYNFRDSSATYHFSGSLGVWSSDGLAASFNGAWDATAPRLRVTNAVPITVAVDDVLSGAGTYLPAREA